MVSAPPTSIEVNIFNSLFITCFCLVRQLLLQLLLTMFYFFFFFSIDPSFQEKISIIMPVHNNENYIKAAIDSVLNQTYTNFELLVIDDFSSDRSVAYAEDYSDSRIKIFKLEANLGAAAARNIGLRNATGDYIAFLDSDDCWLPDKLEIQLDFMKSNHSAFCCSQYYIVDEFGKRLYLMDSPRFISARSLKRCCYIGCLTAMYDRRATGLIQVDERLKKRNDYAIWLQVIQKTSSCRSIPQPLACYRLNSKGISHRKMGLLKWHYRLFRWQMGFSRMSSLFFSIENACFSFFKKAKYRRKLNDDHLK